MNTVYTWHIHKSVIEHVLFYFEVSTTFAVSCESKWLHNLRSLDVGPTF